MKEESILFNGQYLLIKDTSTKIFLHTDNTSALMHLVEGESNNFKRRLEFKKRKNNSCKYITFSYFIIPSIAFSGELKISPEEIITGNISFQFLRDNSTKLLESYYITFGFNSYYIEHIITENIPKREIKNKQIKTPTLENIEILLFNIINEINNTRCIKNKKLIPYHISFNQILREEKRILNLISSLVTAYPQMQEFLNEYTPLERKRRQNH